MSKNSNAALGIVGAEEPVKLRPMDWAGEIDVTTLTLPQMMAHTGGFGLVVGAYFAGGGSISGQVKRITIMPQGFVRVVVEKAADAYSGATGRFGAFVFFGNGMYSEIDNFVHEAITEENSGPWQQSVAVHR